MSTEKRRKPGRPPGYRVENPANKTIPKVRVTESQLEAYKQAAKASGSNFSQWVRGVLDAATKPESKK